MDFDDPVAESSTPFAVGSGGRTPAAEQLRLLEQQLRVRLITGSESLTDGHFESADLLRQEACYLVENLEFALRSRTDGDVAAVLKACDYLGPQLHELRWNLELQTETTQRAVSSLLDSLEPQVRECWWNALRFLEAGDVGLARQHFASLVAVTPICHLAYQYLGFLAARMGDGKEAAKNFELARHHAESDEDRALASSHLAAVWFAAGDPLRAAKAALTAAEFCPDEAKYWYETAVYCAGLGQQDRLEEFLSNAIRRDWLFWPVAIVDPNFGPARTGVARLLSQMREEQRVAALTQFGKLHEIVAILRETDARTEVLLAIEIASNLERELNSGSIFTYLRLIDEIPEAQKKFLRCALEGFDRLVRQAEMAMSRGPVEGIDFPEAKLAQVEAMRQEAAAKEKIGSTFTMVRTIVQLWSAVAVPASAWAIYDYLGAAADEKISAWTRLLYVGGSLVLPWVAVAALLLILHRLPAKLIRRQADNLEKAIGKSVGFRTTRSAEEQERLAAVLDRLLKQRESVAEFLRSLER